MLKVSFSSPNQLQDRRLLGTIGDNGREEINASSISFIFCLGNLFMFIVYALIVLMSSDDNFSVSSLVSASIHYFCYN